MTRVSLCAVLLVVAAGCKANFDPSAPHPYPCQTTADCRDGWICGYEHTCHDPTKPSARLCKTEDDCGGWHCGKPTVDGGFGSCYDRAVAAAYPCRREFDFDAGHDCADGWRCGLGGVCYDLGVPGPYACETDVDCSAGYRCSVLTPRVCVDVTENGLLVLPPSNPDVQLISPRLVIDNGVQPAISPDDYFFLARDGGLYEEPFAFDATLLLADAGDITALASFSDGADAQLIAAAKRGLYRKLSDGPLVRVPLAYDAKGAAASLDVPMGIVWGDHDVVVIPLDGGAARTVPGPLDGGAFIASAAVLTAPFIGSIALLTNRGIYIAPSDGTLFYQPNGTRSVKPYWMPENFAGFEDNQDCTPGAPQRTPLMLRTSAFLSLISADATDTVAAVAGPDGGVSVFDLTISSADAQSLQPCNGTLSGSSSPPAGCATGTFVDLLHLSASPSVECAVPASDGGVEYSYVRPNLDTELASISASLVRPPLRAADKSSFSVDEPGTVWDWNQLQPSVNTSTYSLPFARTFPGGALNAIGFRDGGFALMTTDGANKRIYQWSPFDAIGRWSPSLAPTCGGISGTAWAYAPFNPDSETIDPLAILDTDALTIVPVDLTEVGNLSNATECMKSFGLSVDTREGKVMLVFVRDRLWAFQVTNPDPIAPAALYPPVIVPVPFAQVEGFVAEAGGAKDPLIIAYALVGHRLLRLDGSNVQDWLARELPVPSQHLMISLVDVNGRIRGGLEDGTVLSVPEMVTLSEPTPTPANAFASYCGRIYALTGQQLLRLDARSDSPLGQWVDIPLPHPRPPSDEPRFRPGLLHAEPNGLIVSDDEGTVIKLVDDACAL